MIKKILIISLVLFSIFKIDYTSAYEIDFKIRQAFIKLDKSVTIKYKYDKGLNYYKKIVAKLDLLTQKKELSTAKAKVVSDLKKLINEKIFTLELNEKERDDKIYLNTLTNLKGFEFLYNTDGIKKEGDTWYAYIFTNMIYFDNLNKVGTEEFNHYGIEPSKSLVYKFEDKVYFVKDYTKIKIANNSDIYGIPGKYEVLQFLKKNKVNQKNETSNLLSEIEDKTNEIISGKTTNNEKIKAIYAYILENISYSTNFKLTDYRIYDGVETFKNKNGVCEGYVQLFKLMLAYADIQAEIVVGDVLDAADFPNIGHAWVKIGNKFYDPTFDDPVGSSKTKTFDNYLYFNIPEDIFYTNRYNKGETPESYKKLNLPQRQSLIWDNLYKVSEKYNLKDYKILEPFSFRQKYSLNKKDLTINDFKDILNYKKVNKDFSLDMIGGKKYIKQLNYYTATDSNIEIILKEKFDYKITNNLYLFDWELENGQRTYRLGYNVEFID